MAGQHGMALCFSKTAPKSPSLPPELFEEARASEAAPLVLAMMSEPFHFRYKKSLGYNCCIYNQYGPDSPDMHTTRNPYRTDPDRSCSFQQILYLTHIDPGMMFIYSLAPLRRLIEHGAFDRKEIWKSCPKNRKMAAFRWTWFIMF